MAIKTHTYVRKPLYVEAIQVTEENFSELAVWCQGEVADEPNNPNRQFIQVRVTNPMTPRQSQARVGDWILSSPMGYKVYTPKAFAKAFDLVEDATTAGVTDTLSPMVNPDQVSFDDPPRH